MNIKLITLISFESLAEAYVIKSKLESEGITCFLHDEHIVSMNMFYSQAVGGVKLKVPDDQFEKAKEILESKKPEN